MQTQDLDHAALLRDILSPMPLSEIAEIHSLPPSRILEWLDSPRTAAELRTLTHLAQRRADLLTRLAAPAAIAALIDIASDPSDPAEQRRAAAALARAASELPDAPQPPAAHTPREDIRAALLAAARDDDHPGEAPEEITHQPPARAPADLPRTNPETPHANTPPVRTSDRDPPGPSAGGTLRAGPVAEPADAAALKAAAPQGA